MSDRTGRTLNRRRMLAGLTGGAGLVALGGGACAAEPAPAAPPTTTGATPPTPAPAGGARLVPAQTSWDPVPPMTGSLGQVQIPDVALATWDTGGDGEAVVLMHPHTGDGEIWGYQQSAFADAGYRVISFSRRGYPGSEPGPPDNPGTQVGDLTAVLEVLGVDAFHLVGLAAGGGSVFDAALSIPDRLLSCTLGTTLAGIEEPAWGEVTEAILPAGWSDLPPEFREIGPSYRAAKPAALATWIEHAERPRVGPSQGAQNELVWSAIETVRTPMLLLTGDCDLYMPPHRLREIAGHLPDAEVVIFAESGHAVQWEQYRAFNETVLSFLAKHKG